MARKKKELDESRPGPRFIVLSALLFSGRDAGLLGIEAIRTSPLSMAYAAALATALAATLTVVVRRMSIERPAVVIPDLERTGPEWHKATLFSDPWYQFPAVFCVLILYFRLALDIAAEPPTGRGAWFLLYMAVLLAVFGLTGFASAERQPETREHTDATGGNNSAVSAFSATLNDPWFTVLSMSIGFLHIAQGGLREIEKDPESLFATIWMLIPAAALATIAVLRVRTWGKPQQTAVTVEPGTIGSTGNPDKSNT